LNTPTNQIEPEAVSRRHKSSRLIGPLLLLAGLLLIVSAKEFPLAPFVAFVFLVLSIVWGILDRQWTFVGVVLATIAAILGLGILAGRPNCQPPEPPAVSNLRTINTAQVIYLSSSGGTYGSMTDLIAAKLLDDTFADTLGGYKYSITLDATGSAYTAEAVPASTNTRHFGYYSHPDAVIRYTSLAPPGQAGRSPVQSWKFCI
jgi:hypothetical protein